MSDGWTIDSLKEYMEAKFRESDARYSQRFNDQDKAVSAALSSAEKAVAKAEQASEKRFEGVNEFRQTLVDQASSFISRTEALARADANAEKIDALGSRLDRIEGKSTGLKDYIGYVIAALAIAAFIVDKL